MKKAKLGNTEFEVSRLCFGTLTLSPMQRNLPPKEGAELLLAAFSRGVNLLDTAELYGNYETIALALSQWSESEIVVASKCYAYDALGAQKSLEAALVALNRERIEIFMLHEQESEHTLRGHAEALEYFSKARDEGKIGAIGLSTHFVAGVIAAAKHPLIDIVHPIYNKTGLGIVDGSQSDMEKAVAACHEAGRAVIAMKPLGGGHLISERESALRYLQNTACLDSIALGMQTLAEVEYNCAFFDGRDTSPYASSIASQNRSLLIEYWCKGCGLCVSRCQQKALRLINEKAEVDASCCVFCGYCAAVCPEFCIKVI